MTATISLITATYNASSALPPLIESLRRQEGGLFEWVVADGGSTDGTVALLESCTDLPVRLTSQPDFGIYDALNRAIRMARGDYYLVVGADDFLEPAGLLHLAEAAAQTHADLITAPRRQGKQVRYPGTRYSWRKGVWSFISGHSVGCLIRRSLHERFGYYSRRFPICADSAFLLKAYRGGATIHAIPHIVGGFGTEGVSNADYLGSLSENFRIRMESGNSPWLEIPYYFCRVVKNVMLKKIRG